jgi:hypothetical protein
VRNNKPANGDLHRVIFRLNVESGLRECFDDRNSGVESFHALKSSCELMRFPVKVRLALKVSPTLSLYVPSSFIMLMNSSL